MIFHLFQISKSVAVCTLLNPFEPPFRKLKDTGCVFKGYFFQDFPRKLDASDFNLLIYGEIWIITSGEGCFSGKAPPQAKKTGELFVVT